MAAKNNDQPVTRRELQEALHGLEARLDAKLEALEARLDAKLEALEARIDAKLDALEARIDAKLDAKLDALKDSLQEAIRDAQTEMLRGFAAYAEANQIRVRQLEIGQSAVNLRMDVMERRLLEIEKRLMMNPPELQK